MRSLFPNRSALLLACSLLLVPPAGAHEIPNDVAIQLYVHPEGDRLYVLVRAPLEAMRDIEWPTRGPGYLQFGEAEPLLADAAKIWVANEVSVFESGVALGRPFIAATRVSIPSDPAFATYPTALAHFASAPLGDATNLLWQQAMFDVMLEYPIRSETSPFSIRPGLERLGLRVLTAIRFVPPDGPERVFQFEGDPGEVALDPGWFQAAATFTRLGFDHILSGFDHLLFLLCLVIPCRRIRPLVTVVTAFTVAHSMTLIASAFGLAPNSLWFPPLIETLIAASIVYMAIGNIVRPDVAHRWVIAFGFGLVHGFGFSFALSETMQLAGDHLPAALLSFNIGVEFGQLLVLILVMPAVWLVLKLGVSERVGMIVLSALVGHTAWHWMLERGGALGEYSWTGTPLTSTLIMRWSILLVLVIAVGWLFAIASRSAERNSDAFR